MRDIQTRVRLHHAAVMDVHPVLIGKRGVGAFPCRDTSSAAAKKKFGGFDPQGAESIEEIGLAGNDGLVHVGVAYFADVDL
jgi:hypothetical protein